MAQAAAAISRKWCLQGFEIGSGFAGSRLLGSEHNDEFYMAADGQIRTRTNRYFSWYPAALHACYTIIAMQTLLCHFHMCSAIRLVAAL